MLKSSWKIYAITEDDYIEYARCFEKLEEAGLDQEEIEQMTLNCHTCSFFGRCGVIRESPFLGARTC